MGSRVRQQRHSLCVLFLLSKMHLRQVDRYRSLGKFLLDSALCILCRKIRVQWAIRLAAVTSGLVGLSNRACRCIAALLLALAMGLSKALLAVLCRSVSPHRLSLVSDSESLIISWSQERLGSVIWCEMGNHQSILGV